jgi:hypothetical protein
VRRRHIPKLGRGDLVARKRGGRVRLAIVVDVGFEAFGRAAVRLMLWKPHRWRVYVDWADVLTLWGGPVELGSGPLQLCPEPPPVSGKYLEAYQLAVASLVRKALR